MTSTTQNIVFIRAQWHADIVDQAQRGFSARINELLEQPRIIDATVPGALEIPLLAKRYAQSGQVDAVVAAALIVDGGIYRHDFVAQTVLDGLMDAQLACDVPMFSVMLTPHQFQSTTFHQQQFAAHFVEKGREAADACAAQLSALANVSVSLAG